MSWPSPPLAAGFLHMLYQRLQRLELFLQDRGFVLRFLQQQQHVVFVSGLLLDPHHLMGLLEKRDGELIHLSLQVALILL